MRARVLLVGLLLTLPVAIAAGEVIQPGDAISVGSGGCTMNFVYDAPDGRVFVGTAGHCGSVGHAVSTAGFPNFGTVVYDDDTARDFALIEVKPQFHAFVVADVRGHPGLPKGGHTVNPDASRGDLVLLSGYGTGFSLTQPTREMRAGPIVWVYKEAFCSDSPALWGDSGGPVLHRPSGKAFGVVTDLGLCGGVLHGPTIEGALREAALRGFSVTVRNAS